MATHPRTSAIRTAFRQCTQAHAPPQQSPGLWNLHYCYTNAQAQYRRPHKSQSVAVMTNTLRTPVRRRAAPVLLSAAAGTARRERATLQAQQRTRTPFSAHAHAPVAREPQAER
ncbi:hypothetical protein FA95DRAFT_1551778 [Auriscalpium vulgare]|uniref:Uncharacterized protein n=1 Tax=Auriscalpium vulgare TaxID=40419 RepID=A0ACB8SDJ6_9AGAM|nr:hypothetical protein FA95DRAFT_1551778 [Auriscalpium vulgare]